MLLANHYLLYLTFFYSIFVLKSLSKLCILICSCLDQPDLLFCVKISGYFLFCVKSLGFVSMKPLMCSIVSCPCILFVLCGTSCSYIWLRSLICACKLLHMVLFQCLIYKCAHSAKREFSAVLICRQTSTKDTGKKTCCVLLTGALLTANVRMQFSGVIKEGILVFNCIYLIIICCIPAAFLSDI